MRPLLSISHLYDALDHLGVDDVATLAVTHIHLDHAGGAGHFAARFGGGGEAGTGEASLLRLGEVSNVTHAPAISNSLIAGTDHIVPLMLRAGRLLGPRRLALCRYIILPASLPAFVGGLKQGWAFSWRSLMAGEFLVMIANRHSVREQRNTAPELAQSEWIMATMVVTLVIGTLDDAFVLRILDRATCHR